MPVRGSLRLQACMVVRGSLSLFRGSGLAQRNHIPEGGPTQRTQVAFTQWWTCRRTCGLEDEDTACPTVWVTVAKGIKAGRQERQGCNRSGNRRQVGLEATRRGSSSSLVARRRSRPAHLTRHRRQPQAPLGWIWSAECRRVAGGENDFPDSDVATEDCRSVSEKTNSHDTRTLLSRRP